ncbi:hypothetical protein DSUL_160022 [Desulfovibrionales bacterium]
MNFASVVKQLGHYEETESAGSLLEARQFIHKTIKISKTISVKVLAYDLS